MGRYVAWSMTSFNTRHDHTCRVNHPVKQRLITYLLIGGKQVRHINAATGFLKAVTYANEYQLTLSRRNWL